MDAGLIAVAFRGAAKLALKEAGKSAGKETVNIIFAELFGDDDHRFDKLDQKLKALQSGQTQLKAQLDGLQADVGFRGPLEEIHTAINGLHFAMTRKVSLRNLETILKFLEPAMNDSARALADRLAQKLFGTGQTPPVGFWDPRPQANKIKTLSAGHVINIARRQFHGNVAPLRSYVDNLMALHTELLSYFAPLASALIASHQYMLEVGNPVLREAGQPLYALEADDNPALFEPPGLAGMASDWILDYVIQSSPPAFDLYRSLFIERKERRIGLTTKARNRILEWETESSRRPIQVGHSLPTTHDYEGFKPVYADHEDKGRNSSRQWWRIRLAEAEKPADDAVLLKTDEGERYLGEHTYLHYSKQSYYTSGVNQNYSNEIGIDGSASDPLSRWRLHLRQENVQGETTFVLEHKSTGRCLLVNGLDSTKNRQIHLDQSVKDRGDWIDYAFKVVDSPA